jgi:hypothetical protein
MGDNGTKRIIESTHDEKLEKTWSGRTEPETYDWHYMDNRRWKGKNPEVVEDAMNKDLGHIPTSEYEVRE